MAPYLQREFQFWQLAPTLYSSCSAFSWKFCNPLKLLWGAVEDLSWVGEVGNSLRISPNVQLSTSFFGAGLVSFTKTSCPQHNIWPVPSLPSFWEASIPFWKYRDRAMKCLFTGEFRKHPSLPFFSSSPLEALLSAAYTICPLCLLVPYFSPTQAPYVCLCMYLPPTSPFFLITQTSSHSSFTSLVALSLHPFPLLAPLLSLCWLCWLHVACRNAAAEDACPSPPSVLIQCSLPMPPPTPLLPWPQLSPLSSTPYPTRLPSSSSLSPSFCHAHVLHRCSCSSLSAPPSSTRLPCKSDKHMKQNYILSFEIIIIIVFWS